MLAKSPRLAAAEDDEDDGNSNDGGDGTNNSNTTPADLINYGTTPQAAAGKKYVEDDTFKMDDPEHAGQQIDYTVVLTQQDINSIILDRKAAWTWDSLTARAGLPAADENGNLYYYFIKSVSEEGIGLYTKTTVKLDEGDTFLVGRDKHFNSTTNTPQALEVNNEILLVGLNVEKAWGPTGSTPPTGAEATFELYYAKRAMTNTDGVIPEGDRAAWPTDLSGYAPVAGAAELANARISPTELTLSASSSPTAWKGSFQNLPKTIMGDDGIVYEIRYYAKEISVMIPGKDKIVLDDTAINVLDQYTQSYDRTDPAPATAATSDGTVKVTNTKETVKVTVQKEWDPVPTDPNASVTVQLRRYAKKTKGTIGVVLKDNTGAAIQGAEYKLYEKVDGSWTATNRTALTDVNGRASISGLGPGTYKLVQISTPAAYAMSQMDANDNFSYVTESNELTVVGNATTQQVKWTDNANKRKVTAGTATLTVTGIGKAFDQETESWGMSIAAPVEGATVTLYKDNAIYKDAQGHSAQGLTTDENGQVTVSGLPAGRYYFYLDAVTADHVLPATENERKSSSFTIDENPGVEQNVQVEIEDVNAAARGYVAVTLRRADDNGLVEGATFTLTGDGRTLTATTGSNGVATFGTPADKLNAGTYTIHQVSSADGLKPAAADQTITIDEWSEHDNNQTVEVEFTNITEGKGTVSITVQKENNAGPVANATVQLKQGGEVVRTGTTDSNGVVTFDNLGEGTYTVHQETAGSVSNEYDPASDPEPFTVVEGDAGQTFTYTLTDERITGYATIKLWKKNGRTSQWSWVLVNTYQNLKINKTYSFTANVKRDIYWNDGNDNNDHLWYYWDESAYDNAVQNGEFLNQSRIQNLIGDNWNDGTYTFTFTPTTAGKTYSIVLVTDWDTGDIYSISKDEENNANATGTTMNAMASSASALRLMGRKLQAVANSLTAAGDESSDDQTTGNDNASGNGTASGNGGSGPLRAIADAQPTPLSADIADDYVEDNEFPGQTYTITSSDTNWSHAFDPEDKYDPEGNLYYYYVVETAHTPTTAAGYYISKYEGDPRSDTGNIKITNTQERGGLTITKAVKVDGNDVPAAVPTIADGTYTFTITGPSYPTGHEETITVTNGQAESTIVLNDLYAGTYTIAETGSTNPNGITLAANQTVTVAPGTLASANTVAFTNNLETTQLTVNKVWTDSETVDHSDHTVKYDIYRIPYTVAQNGDITEYEPEPVAKPTFAAGEKPVGYTGSLTAHNEPAAWTENIIYLPKAGVHTLEDSTTVDVLYEYYVTEEEFDGYRPHVSGGLQDDGKYSFTINNEPRGTFDETTQVDVAKEWKNSDGTPDTGSHDNDSITFNLEQYKYYSEYQPVRINLINGDGTTSSLSETVYILKDKQLNLTAWTTSNGHKVNVSGAAKNGSFSSGKANYISNGNGGKEVTFTLQNRNDKWGTAINGTTWRLDRYDNSNNGSVTQNDYMVTFDQLLAQVAVAANARTNSHDPYEYTMSINDGRTGTTVIKSASAIGNPVDNDAEKWKGGVNNLPLYEKGNDGEFYVYTYEVTEIKIGAEPVGTTTETGFNGETSAYFVKWGKNSSTGLWTITNQKKPAINITIHKVDVENFSTGSPLLPGAKFRLEKSEQLRPWNKTADWSEVSDTEQNPGVFTFEGLEAGYYKVIETKCPDGYVKTGNDPIFQVRFNNQTHAMEAVLVDATGTVIQNNLIDGTIKINNNTITLSNEPGAELPNAGGSGTRGVYILGGMFTAFAVIMLGRRKTRR